jgi:hypothetical protein
VLTNCSHTQSKSKTMSDTEDDYLLTGRVARKPTMPKGGGGVGAQKFTKATKAYKHLEQLFKEKAIQPTDKPSDVRLKDPLFMDFTNQQFRSQFNKLKGMHGTCTKEGTYIRSLLPLRHCEFTQLNLLRQQAFGNA